MNKACNGDCRNCKNHCQDYIPEEVTIIEAVGDAKLGVAVDLGTTTIAVALANLRTGQKVATYSMGNSQRKYGADVVSRIMAACNGDGLKLQQAVNKDIEGAIAKLCNAVGILPEQIQRGVIAANTTMVHLLMGYPVEGLAAYPFKPYSLDFAKATIGGVDFCVLPGIAAFVGGDIVAGLYALDIADCKGKYLLLDLGTNGEIVAVSDGHGVATSTAAGPALEAAGISCGMPCVAGAISSVEFVTPTTIKCSSIANTTPVGLCGSGVVDTVAGLFEQGLIDTGGLFTSEELQDEGIELTEDIFFLPEDVQQVLLAKSAISAGTQILMNKAQLEPEKIDKVFLAGGLGSGININSAKAIGLISPMFRDKVETVGNTSLDGAARFLVSQDEEKILSIVKGFEVVDLGNEVEFETLFLNNLFL